MRIFWTILGVAGALVLLVLVGAAIAVWTIDVNQFVAPVAKRVKDATGRDLAIDGGIDLKLGLVPKLVANDVRLSNAPWARGPQMLTAKRVEADVALLPLLQRRFEVVRLSLVDPVITLEVDARGRGNWEFAAAGGAAAAGGGAVSALASFGIGNVEITNGALTYRDGASGNVTRIAIDRFAAYARTPQSPINAEFTGKVDDVPVALTGNLGSLETLLSRRAPYPIAVDGRIGSQQARVTTMMQLGERTVQFGELDVGIGASKAKGEAVVATGGARPKISLKIVSPTLALADLSLPLGAAAPPPRAAEKAARRAHVFSDEPISFAALRSLDIDGDVSIGELKLAEGRRLEKVRARFTVKDGRLEAPELVASLLGGTVRAALTIDASRAADPTLKLLVDARGLDLEGLLAAAGTPRKVSGGKTDITIDVRAHGTTERQWARDVDGTVQVVVGPATLVNTKLDLDSSLSKLAQAVNPFRDRTPSTELSCAVVRLPLHDGIARIDRTLAAETRELGVAASGTLNLRDETIDLAFAPRVKQGLPIDLPQIAELVRLRGPLASPHVEADAKASAAAIAKLGAAVATGGLSAVGSALLASAASGDAGPCDVALGKAPPPAATATATAPGSAAVSPDELGKALGRLLGR